MRDVAYVHDDATYYSIVNDLDGTLCIHCHTLFHLIVPDAQMSQQVLSDVIATSSSFAYL